MYLLLSQYGNGVRWIYPVSCYINNGSGRGSKISLNSRLKLSASLFKQSLAIKKINSLLFSLYMSFRFTLSYFYKKVKRVIP